MKRNSGIFLFLISIATTALAQTSAQPQPPAAPGAAPAPVSIPAVTAADREKAMQYLEKTRQAVVDATSVLTEAQWNFKAGPDRWSVAEVTEHIAAAEDFIRGNIEEKVLNAPPRTDGGNAAEVDAMVLQVLPDRSKKFQAPEPIKPNNRFGSPEGSLKHFAESRAKTEALLKDHADLRAHATDSPLGKQLDGYEWILFLTAHSERHTKQILEVKADPNFPKK